MVTIEGQRFLNIREVAGRLGCHRVTAAKLVKANKIKGFKLAGKYHVKDDNIKKFLREAENGKN